MYFRSNGPYYLISVVKLIRLENFNKFRSQIGLSDLILNFWQPKYIDLNQLPISYKVCITVFCLGQFCGDGQSSDSDVKCFAVLCTNFNCLLIGVRGKNVLDSLYSRPSKISAILALNFGFYNVKQGRS